MILTLRWEERHHNIPSGSELRWAYAWLNFTEDGRTYLSSDVATVDELWFDAWQFKPLIYRLLSCCA